MENPEKLATLGTQNTEQRQTKKPTKTMQHKMRHTNTQANTINVNNTRAFLQTTGGKD